MNFRFYSVSVASVDELVNIDHVKRIRPNDSDAEKTDLHLVDGEILTIDVSFMTALAQLRPVLNNGDQLGNVR